MSMKTVCCGILIVSTALLAGAGGGRVAQSPREGRASYLVQAGSVAQAAAAVEAVGARVERRLGIVRAVSARLSGAERAAVRLRPGVRTVWEDAPVRAAIDAPCAVQGSGRLEFSTDKVRWRLTNNTASTLYIKEVLVGWPATNGYLEKVRLGADTLYDRRTDGTEVGIDASALRLDLRDLKAYSSVDLELDFQLAAVAVQGAYDVETDFGTGCATVFKPYSASCQVRGAGYLEYNSNRLRWYLTNDGDTRINLADVQLGWPAVDGDLRKVKLAAAEIWNTPTPPPGFASAGRLLKRLDERKIDPHQTQPLELEWAVNLERIPERYELVADFGNGCVVTFLPAGSGALGVGPSAVSRVIGADRLHSEAVTGTGVTVAVVDTGLWREIRLKNDSRGVSRVLASYDAIAQQLGDAGTRDRNGHGTHVTGIIASSERWSDGRFAGIAPDVRLVVVRALDENGVGTYGSIIGALDWMVANKDRYGIRVANLSLSATPRTHYWDDPLNQAVMAAWRAGIFVVASAGNGGPAPMTIGVPANVPYVMTVGASSDAVTPETAGDDFLTSFSAAGPTVEGFVKPDLVAPGGHVRGVMGKTSLLARLHPELHDRGKYFAMSGTSQAAAVVSGVAALVLQVSPWLPPDDVKCRLLSTARPAVRADGTAAYSVFQQGAGMVDAYAAARTGAAGCANRGLDVAADLAGAAHFGGPANRDASGTYYLMDTACSGSDCPRALHGDGYIWTGGYVWSGGYIWTNSYAWSDGYIWTNGYIWTLGYPWTDAALLGSGYIWTGAYASYDGYVWTSPLSQAASIGSWVQQE